MKKLIFALAAFAATALGAATPVTLRLGENAPPAGEVVALEAITTNATAAVKVVRVVSVLSYTNVTAYSIKEGVMYYFGLTNWHDVAYVPTNSWNRFDFADWTALGTNHVVGPIVASNTVLTNAFTTLVPGEKFWITNALFNASAANHYLMATNPATRFLSGSGKLVVTGASPEDRLTIFIR